MKDDKIGHMMRTAKKLSSYNFKKPFRQGSRRMGQNNTKLILNKQGETMWAAFSQIRI
jgi:hypothetical protein